VVVAVGLMLMEPLADVDVKVPGLIATPVAPATSQLSVLLEPEFMLVGFAVKEVIVGAAPFSEFDPDVAPQPPSPAQANSSKTRISAQRSSLRMFGSRQLQLLLQDELVGCMLIPVRPNLMPMLSQQ